MAVTCMLPLKFSGAAMSALSKSLPGTDQRVGPNALFALGQVAEHQSLAAGAVVQDNSQRRRVVYGAIRILKNQMRRAISIIWFELVAPTRIAVRFERGGKSPGRLSAGNGQLTTSNQSAAARALPADNDAPNRNQLSKWLWFVRATIRLGCSADRGWKRGAKRPVSVLRRSVANLAPKHVTPYGGGFGA
jgi:hypothetical protein